MAVSSATIHAAGIDPAPKFTRPRIRERHHDDGHPTDNPSCSRRAGLAAVSRYWFDGPKQGGRRRVGVDRIFLDIPANINRSSDGNLLGGACSACVRRRSSLPRRCPGFRRRMARRIAPDLLALPQHQHGLRHPVQRHRTGSSKRLWDLGGVNHPMITSMREHKVLIFISAASPTTGSAGTRFPERRSQLVRGQTAYWGTAGVIAALLYAPGPPLAAATRTCPIRSVPAMDGPLDAQYPDWMRRRCSAQITPAWTIWSRHASGPSVLSQRLRCGGAVARWWKMGCDAFIRRVEASQSACLAASDKKGTAWPIGLDGEGVLLIRRPA